MKLENKRTRASVSKSSEKHNMYICIHTKNDTYCSNATTAQKMFPTITL